MFLGVVLAPQALAVLSPTCTGSPTVTCTFAYTDQVTTGGYQWAVPLGVSNVSVDLFGAQGGGKQNGAPALQGIASGGKGAHVSLALSVSPGDLLDVQVGQQGAPPSPTVPTTGAFPTGGPGGSVSGTSGLNGGGGGGASVVRRAGLALLVAAGGGGAAGNAQGFDGGASGTDGPSAQGGGAAKSGANGGLGGAGGVTTLQNCGSTQPGVAGTNGTPFAGGTGGSSFFEAGGGGGDGYVGGGGGGGGWYCTLISGPAAGGAGGGAGGSSWTNALPGQIVDGVQTGDGVVTITYTIAVNKTADTADPTYPRCTPSDCTLREAILDANQSAGLDTITFAIPGSGEHIIQPLSPLPAITSPTLLDGSSQVDGNGLPLVRIDGALAGAADGVHFSVPPSNASSLVNKLAFTKWSGFGLNIDTSPVTVHGSIFGTNHVSAAGLANGGGAAVASASTIGGTGGAPDRNYFVGGQTGIGLSGQALVQGNYVGFAPDGTTVMGAGTQGILVSLGGATIGGPGAGASNTITGNAVGIRLQSGTTGTTIVGNAIYGNTFLGITTGFSGVPTQNDTPDAAPQNYPVLTTATQGGGLLQVAGTLVSNLSSPYLIDIYASASCDSSGNGEGASYLGQLTTNTDANGSASFSGSVNAPPSGQIQITGTATNSQGSTSEFSTCLTVAGAVVQPGPVFTVTNASDASGACLVGNCSLREAIVALNGLDQSSGTISFAFTDGSPSPHVIALSPNNGKLPTIAKGVTIDARGQGNVPTVVVDGEFGGNGMDTGLDFGLGSQGSAVSGLVIQNFRCGGACGGVDIHVASSGNTFTDNYLGTTGDGTAAASNDTAIEVDGATDTVIDGNVIATRSVGVDIIGVGGHNGTTVTNNSIGVGADGTSFPPSDSWDVGVSHADDVTVSDNVLGNSDDAIAPLSSKNLAITGNFIGVGSDGVTPQPNLDFGIFWNGSALDGPVNGSITDNVISGNTLGGIALSTVDGVTIVGNTVSDNGIASPSGADGIEIAGNGNVVGPANIITGNGQAGALDEPGVAILSGSGNKITQNSIDGNASLGIDLAGDGVTLNNSHDPGGPNDWQNMATNLAASVNGGTTHVTGTLNAGLSSSYTIEFFASPSHDPSGYGQGATYIGSKAVTTGSGGTATFAADLSLVTVPAGSWISATATSDGGSTSEFSQSVQATSSVVQQPGQVTISPEADTYVALGAPGTNFGSLPYADTYGGNNANCVLANGTSYTLMRFDLSALPAGAHITHVELDTTTRAGWAQNGDPDHWAIYVASDTWGESTTTWNNRPDDGILPVGTSTVNGSDVRGSSISNGGAGVFRNTCAQDPAANQSIVFPSDSDGLIAPVAQAETNFVNRVQSKLGPTGDGKLSLELWQPTCLPAQGQQVPCASDGSGYWARYWTREASDPSVRPKLVVQYSIDGTITLTATPTAKAVGTVPLAGIPPSVFFGAVSSLTSAPVGSVPVGSVPLASVPLASVPLGSVPVASVPLASVPVASVGGDLLASIALSTIPLTPPQSWSEILKDITEFAGRPLQNITLADVLANATTKARLNAAPLASVDLSRTALGSLTPAAVGLGSTPLASVPVPGPDGLPTTDPLAAWCAWLRGPPINCINPNTLAGATLTSAALNGAPVASVPVGSVPVASVPVGSVPVGSVNIANTPVGSVPLGSVPVGSVTIDRVSIAYSPVGSVPLASVPVASVPLASVPVASVRLAGSPLGSVPVASVRFHGACINDTCTGGPTLADVTNLRPDLTVGQLLDGISPDALRGMTLAGLILAITPAQLHDLTIADLIASLPTPNSITYADVLALLLQPGGLNWENFDLAATPVQPYASDAERLKYQADAQVTGGTADTPVDAKVHVTVPKGGVYEKGSARLVNLSDVEQSLPLPGDPTTLNNGSLEWTLHLTFGTPYRLKFNVLPPLSLGLTSASADITPTGGATTAVPTDATSTIADAFGAHDSVGTAVPMTADNFYLSHIGSPGNVGLYTFDVPASGARTTFRLSHLPADYDLVVYGPAGQQLLPDASAATPPLDGQPLADDGYGTTHVTDALAPQTLNDVPVLQSLPLAGVSTLRGTQDDSVVVVSHGETGHYTIQVSGFNGAFSDDPYMLRGEVTPPPVDATCTPRALTLPAATSPLLETTAGQVASAVKTLFVVDDQQLKALYPTTSDTTRITGATTLAKLSSSLAGFASAGFPSAVVHVDADSTVRTAYGLWNGCPGNPTLANGVVSAVASAVRSARTTFPNAEYVVLVGGDDAIPFARIDDLTTVSNESGYAETFTRSTALGGSLSRGQLLTDDPYGTTDPLPFLGRQLFVPDLVLGRLVEDPADINRQIDAFLAPGTGGHLRPASADTAGYDFLTDGATGVRSALSGIPGVTSRTDRLIGDSWTQSDLTTALASPADILSINAHADHNRFKPAAGDALFTAQSLVGAATNAFGGRLIFTMGCHAGLSVFDAFVAINHLDWAQLWASKGAAAYVANTGFGYGDSDTVAYSEDLNVRFARNVATGAGTTGGSDLTLGEALTVAKQEYKASLALVGAYDQKAMAELTFYGLPMYRIGGTAPAAAAPAFRASTRTAAAPLAPTTPSPVLGTDPATGLATQSVSLDKNFADALPDLVSTPHGAFYNGTDGLIVEHFRPIEPKGIVPIAIARAHGALITELTSRDVDHPFDPVYARPTVDQSAHEPEVTFDDVAFPGKLQAVTTFKRLSATKQQLVLAQGQFFSGTDGSGLGTQRLFTHEAATVFSSTSNDYTQPTFTTLDAQKTTGHVTFAITVADQVGAVKRVVIAYKDGSGGTWKFLGLASSDGIRWTGTGTLSSDHLQYFAQALDVSGNVGVSTNKGLLYDETAPTAATGGVAVTTVQTPPSGSGGWFDTNVTVKVKVNGVEVPTNGATVSVDGKPAQPYTVGGLVVTGDGLHTILATTPTGSATTSLLIDTQPPQITVGVPADGGTLIKGQAVTPQFSCTDAGIGIVTCTGSAATIDTSTTGAGSFTVNATDGLNAPGHSSQKIVHYTVKDPLKVTVSGTPLNGWYKVAPTITVEAPVGETPAPGVVTYTVNGGTVKSYTGPITPTSDGQYLYAFTAFGNPANTISKQVNVDSTKPAITIVTPPATTATYPRSAAPPASYTCTDVGGSGIATSGCTATAKLGATGTPVTVPNSGALPADAQGTYTFVVTATDSAGNVQTSAARSYIVGPPTGLTPTTIVFTRLNRIYTLDTGVTGAVAVPLTGTSGDPLGVGKLDDQAVRTKDGKKIVFVRRSTATGTPTLWVIDPDGRGAASLGITGDFPALNADSSKIAYAAPASGALDVWAGPFTGSSITAPTNLTKAAGNDTQPTWSPLTSGTSGNLIAFASDRNKGQYEIFTMAANNGAAQTRITNDPATDWEPAWSPDGSRIAFSSNRAGGTGGFEIYVMGTPNGSSQARLTNLAGTDSAPTWLSATQILFASAQVGPTPVGGLATVSPTGTGLTKLAGSKLGDANPG